MEVLKRKENREIYKRVLNQTAKPYAGFKGSFYLYGWLRIGKIFSEYNLLQINKNITKNIDILLKTPIIKLKDIVGGKIICG